MSSYDYKLKEENHFQNEIIFRKQEKSISKIHWMFWTGGKTFREQDRRPIFNPHNATQGYVGFAGGSEKCRQGGRSARKKLELAEEQP